jgi:hypothetical protein
MDNGDFGVRLSRQEAEQIGGHFAFPDLPDGRPARPDAGKECQRAIFVEGEPDRLL